MRSQTPQEQARQLEADIQQDLKKQFVKFCQTLARAGYEPEADIPELDIQRESDLAKWCHVISITLNDVLASKAKSITPQVKEQARAILDRAVAISDVLDTNRKIENKGITSKEQLNSYLGRMEQRAAAAGDQMYKDFLRLQMLETAAMLVSMTSEKKADDPALNAYNKLVDAMLDDLPPVWRPAKYATREETEKWHRQTVEALGHDKGKKDVAKREAFIVLLEAVQWGRDQVKKGESVHAVFADGSRLMKALDEAILASRGKKTALGKLFKGDSKLAEALIKFKNEKLPVILAEIKPGKAYSASTSNK